MKSEVYQKILDGKAKGKKLFALLLDPEKCTGDILNRTLAQLLHHHPDFIFIGGSTGMFSAGKLIEQLAEISVPKVLFPGDASQFSDRADALLFLSLISGRNSDYLIGQHVQSAVEVRRSGIEVIPTGYILIDGGRNSAVERVSQTKAIAAGKAETAVATAIAGELLGMKMIYLEAGSGAKQTVSPEMVQMLRENIDIPLIVGGGIRQTEQVTKALKAGADLIVIGNALEQEPERIREFVRFFEAYNNELI